MGDNQCGGAHVNCVEIFLTVVSGQLRLMIKKFFIFKPECKFAFFVIGEKDSWVVKGSVVRLSFNCKCSHYMHVNCKEYFNFFLRKCHYPHRKASHVTYDTSLAQWCSCVILWCPKWLVITVLFSLLKVLYFLEKHQENLTMHQKSLSPIWSIL